MKIKFCGAAREVTGSSHLLTLNSGFTILLDCGLYQGRSADMENFNATWLFDPSQLDCLLLSHAHIDHCGRIPALVRDGFRGTIFCTHATRHLAALLMTDSAKIQEYDAEYQRKKGFKNAKPLYTQRDAAQALRQFASYGYETPFQIADGSVEVLFRDAGHILGSASITLNVKEKEKTTRLGFSGDIGRPNRPILRNPLPLPDVDFLICESTYGDKDHLSAPNEDDHFLEIIRHTCIDKKGKVIIPAFGVGRVQEIVYTLDRLQTAGKLPKLPIYVDSPLAVSATEIFNAHPECFDQDLSNYLRSDGDPFGMNSVHYIRETNDSKQLNSNPAPCIIISPSGMMNAGRVQHHLSNNIENPRATILIVGYCAPHTPGGELLNGAKEIFILGQKKSVRADVELMSSFSAHGDRHEMLEVIRNQQKTLKKLFLVHGEYETQQAFSSFLSENGFQCPIEIPALGEEISL